MQTLPLKAITLEIRATYKIVSTSELLILKANHYIGGFYQNFEKNHDRRVRGSGVKKYSDHRAFSLQVIKQANLLHGYNGQGGVSQN